jgi:antitoxin HigA-1
MTSILPPIHPGEILFEEYLAPMNLSAGALAKALGVPRTRIERLAAGKTSVTPDTALRLAQYLGTSPELWMNMQAGYDLKIEAKAKRFAISKIVPSISADGEVRKAA